MSLKDILDFAKSAASALATRELTRVDREEGIRRLGLVIQTMTPEQFDAFEFEYLNNCLLLMEPSRRTRSYELYAMLKFMEVQKYGQFRGFVTDGGPIP